MKNVSALFICVLFGLGLIISGIVNPAKVLGFLDIFGEWDASLAFVMGGAVVVTFFGYRWIGRAGKPWFDIKFRFPTAKHIDKKLIVGAILFGIGWGLVGLCPGPALAAFLIQPWALMIFGVGLTGGMVLTNVLSAKT